MSSQTSKQAIIDEALRLGFYDIGFAKAEYMETEARKLEHWLDAGYAGKLDYMSNHFDKRVDPTKLVPDSKTVISLAYNYHSPNVQPKGAPKISTYAYGKDYHYLVKHRIKSLFYFIQENYGSDIFGRCFVDSAPVLERDWAKRSGNGWIGKNTMLIHPKKGSFFFLGEIILDFAIEPDAPIKDYCGTCRKCIDACPTDAISPEGYFMDGSKCISYLTIELREAIPDEFAGKMEGWAFGCDICQEVCPWNRFSEKHNEEAFEPNESIKNFKEKDWMEIGEEEFKKVFSKSAVKRTKFQGFIRNLKFLKKSAFILFLGALSFFACQQPNKPVAISQEVESVTQTSGVSLIVLGNVQDAGSPHIACKKNCCKDLFLNPDPDRMVVSLGIIDHDNNQQYIFEASPDFSRQLLLLNKKAGVDPSKMPDGVFITHAHIGHYTGLMYLGREAKGAKNVPVYVMPQMHSFLSLNGPWSQLIDLGNIAVKELEENIEMKVSEQLKVLPIKVPHRDEFSETVGFKILGPNKTALFIPDIDKWNKWSIDIRKLIKEVDYAFVDATFYSAAEINHRDISEIPHPFVIESLALFDDLEKSEKGKIHFIHLNHTNPLLNEGSKETKDLLRKGFMVARTGDEISL